MKDEYLDKHTMTPRRYAESYDKIMRKRDAFFRLAGIVICFIAVVGSIIFYCSVVYWVNKNSEWFLN